MGDAFISAGYFLTRRVACDFLPRDRFSSSIVTLNEHLTSTLPSAAFLAGSESFPGEREAQRRRVMDFFSIVPARREELSPWMLDRGAGEVDWFPEPCAVTVSFLRETARRFLPSGSDAVMVGIAVATEDVERMSSCFATAENTPSVPGWLMRRDPPEPGGRTLGYEPAPVLCECPQRGCSWICEGLDWEQVERERGLRCNDDGLLDTYEQARRASAWLDDVGAGCGGGSWFAWRITEYATRA